MRFLIEFPFLNKFVLCGLPSFFWSTFYSVGKVFSGSLVNADVLMMEPEIMVALFRNRIIHEKMRWNYFEECFQTV